MKAYVITLTHIEESVKCANKCIKSAAKFGIEADIFPAIGKDISNKKRIENNVKIEGGAINDTFSNPDAVMGCFMSHFMLWKKCVQLDEPIICLEHDAVFNSAIPDVQFDYCVNIGKPSYSGFKQPSGPGHYNLFSKPHFPGTHAFIVKPKAAREFIKYAKNVGMSAADMYMHSNKFPWLTELYPWPVHVEETFTTVQKDRGTKTKHAYNESYKIL